MLKLLSLAALLVLSSFGAGPLARAGDPPGEGGPAARATPVKREDAAKVAPLFPRSDPDRIGDGLGGLPPGVGPFLLQALQEYRNTRDGDRLLRGLLGGKFDADSARAAIRFLEENGFRPVGAKGDGVPRSFWERYVDRFPEDPYGQAGLGRAERDRGDFEGSVRAFDRAIKDGAETSDNYFGRGFAAERLGDAEQGHSDAGAALSLDPSNPNALALYNLTRGRASRVKLGLGAEGLGPIGVAEGAGDGLVPLALGPGPGAISRMEERPGPAPREGSPAATAAQTSNALAREAARALKVDDQRSAIAAASRALALNPYNVQAHNLRAMAYDRSGDHDRAIADATMALALAPGNAPVLNTRAWAYNGKRLFSAALQDAYGLLKNSPSNGFGLVNAGRAEGGLGRRPAMLEALRLAAETDPRLRATYEAAKSLPADSDTELLFTGGVEAPRPAPGSDRNRRFLWTMLSSVVGGVLVAAGLLHVVSGGRGETLSTTLRRALARGRPAEGVPSREGSAFWSRHEFRRVIASGGMGIVYEAVDTALGRRVAVKKMRGEIRDDPAERERFLKEARLVAGLQHPHIVQIYGVVEEGPDIYLVFEYVDGHTLAEVMKRRGRVAFAEAVDVLKGVCAALQHAHDHGVIHRDLKPSNIMLAQSGEAKVMDFGVARQAKEALAKLTMTSTVCGTPPYMAPEAEQGVICRESDVYALGICLYELVTGRPPFEGASGTMLLNKMAGKFESASRRVQGLPVGFDEVVAKALSPAPDARYRQAAELWTAIAELA